MKLAQWTILLLLPGMGVAGAAEKVEALYARHCVICHGEDLKGGLGASLVDGQWSAAASERGLEDIIRHGQPELSMPPFQDQLSDAEIRALAIFIREREKRALAAPPPAPDLRGVIEAGDARFRVERIARGLAIPWAVEFLPGGRFLVTERPGSLRVIRSDGTPGPAVEGTPGVRHRGQGGLLDVTLHPRYAENGWIYLAYSDPRERDGQEVAFTKIVRGRIRENRWTDQETIFEAPLGSYGPEGHHFGCRIVFDGDENLYFSIGDRGRQDQAQDTNRPNGKTHRLRDDGSVPPDNPFADGGAPSVWTYGNRNAQGLAFRPGTGELWEVEHGPRGGDELNRLEAGKNYGWPVITYGMNYNGTPITGETARPGMEQPATYWTPSIAVSGMDFYTGGAFPAWAGRLLVGSLRQEELHLITLDGDQVTADEVILKDRGRIRDVRTGPDGAVYLVVNEPDELIRLVPVK